MNAKRCYITAARVGGVLLTWAALTMHGKLALADTPTICVTSNGELASALAIAQTSAVSIELMQGSYDLKSTIWSSNAPNNFAKFYAGSSLSGGYIGTTCATQNIDRDNTTITDSSAFPLDQVQILGDATIQGLTFHLKDGFAILADGTSNAGLSAGTQLTLRRNVFTQTMTKSGTSPISMYWNATTASGGTIRLVDNLVFGNSSPSDVGAVQLVEVSGKPTFEAINNTIDNNSGLMEGILLQVQSAVPIYAYNNILFGNSGFDLDITASTNITLASNTIGTHSYPNTATVTGAKSGDPKLDSNYEPITAPVSPSINTGTSSVIGGLPTTDLPGNPRQIGSEPDRGAYESNDRDLTAHVVTNTSDSGNGSLRDAITQSNTDNVATEITFNLGSACPYTISPSTALPAITAPIRIEGYSQAGTKQNDLESGNDASLCVILDGTAHHLADGLVVSSAASDDTSVTIDGIAFSGFSHGAVTMSGGSGHTIWGSRVGGEVPMNGGVVSLDPVGNGIIIGPAVSGVTIGGDTTNLALMNILGSATGSGIVMDGANDTDVASHDNQAIGNYIGVGWSTLSSVFTNIGNGGPGVIVAGPNNTLSRNFIEYNGGFGVELTSANAHGNNVQYNNIGALGSYTNNNNGNGGGVLLQNDASDNELNYNEIWFNTGPGVRILNGQNNSLIENSIFDNLNLGIDLAGAGVTPNDNDSDAQAADYANKGLNFPVITSAIGTQSKGTITGTLTTTPGTYSITLYQSTTCDPSGYGQGEFLLHIIQVTTSGQVTDGQATATFSDENPQISDFVTSPFITATATDASGNTSEFSACFTYVEDTIFANGFED